jgi:uncharacterized repeat protein (TIGR03803 family)
MCQRQRQTRQRSNSLQETIMTNPPEHSTFILRNTMPRTACVVALFCLLTTVAMPAAEAQTFQVLHTFSAGADGADPIAGLTIDGSGNLYGTAESGGIGCTDFGCGTVYKVVRRGATWLTTPIYSFAGAPDGANPVGRVIFGPDGALYGTTSGGGTGCTIGFPGCGTIFKLQPPPTFCGNVRCPWKETILYRFTSPVDGYSPQGDLVFDAAGNLYGTTQGGGTGPCEDYAYRGCGTVFKLTHNGDGSWSKSTLYSFQGPDGEGPDAGVVLDQAGNIYGTTAIGGLTNCGSNGSGCGVVFELAPSGSGWTETMLHTFTGGADGNEPVSGLISDSAGNLYGTTYYGGAENFGVVYQLTPGQDGWTFAELYSFTDTGGLYPIGPLTLDTAGNLYGTASDGGMYGTGGTLYKLTWMNGQWINTTVYSLNFQGPSGGFPQGKVVIDAAGNLYSTSSTGPYPSPDAGTVWEVTP